MSAPRRSLVITQHHPILITRSGQAVCYHLGLGSQSPSRSTQERERKKSPTKSRHRVKTQRSGLTIMTDTFNHLTRARDACTHAQKSRAEIQLFPRTPHIANVIMDVWSGSWEPLVCMINNRSSPVISESSCSCGLAWRLCPEVWKPPWCVWSAGQIYLAAPAVGRSSAHRLRKCVP